MAKTHTTVTTPNGTLVQREVTVTPDPASSVEIMQNAKGQAQVCITVYGEDPERAAQQALSLYWRLTAALADGALRLPPETAVGCPQCGRSLLSDACCEGCGWHGED